MCLLKVNRVPEGSGSAARAIEADEMLTKAAVRRILRMASLSARESVNQAQIESEPVRGSVRASPTYFGIGQPTASVRGCGTDFPAKIASRASRRSCEVTTVRRLPRPAY